MNLKTKVLSKTRKTIDRVAQALAVALLVICTGFKATAIQSKETISETQITVSISNTDMSIGDAMLLIERQTGLHFFYPDAKIDIEDRIRLSKGKIPLETLLSTITGSKFGYSLENGMIILTPKVVKENQDGKITATGIVTDTKGEPLPGITVQVIEISSKGAITDMDGKFTISGITSDSSLKLSGIGFKEEIVRLQGASMPLHIALKEDSELLDEVVVVGYGTQKKSDVTGAISTVKMEDEPLTSYSSVTQALAGKAAGLQVNTISAQPGGSASFKIRGAASVNGGNDPLIIVDGFPVSSSSGNGVGYYSAGASDNILLSISPDDISSIEVLKDASATAIYGSRAGHGVIIITTKKGATGAPKITYSGNVSYQKMTNEYEMLGAADFMKETNRYTYENWLKENHIGVYGNNTEVDASAPYVPRFSDQEISLASNGTDWFDEVTHSGFQTGHNLSITGGNDNTLYRVSGNYFFQNGVVKNNDLQRFVGRIDLTQKLSSSLKLSVSLNLSEVKSSNVPLGAGQNEYAGILVSASQFNPLIKIQDEQGNYMLNPEAAFLPNPVSLLEITNKSIKNRLLGTTSLEYRPIEDLLLKLNLGLDKSSHKMQTYLPKSTLYGAKKNGQADIGQFDNNDLLLELTGNYSKDFGNHRFSILGGYSFQRFASETLTAGNSDFITDAFKYNNLSAGAYPSPNVGSYAGVHEMASFFGRINYSFLERYIITATLRADGASNFSEENRWGYFPSVALAWRFSEEEFLKNDVLSNGKVRLSFGQTGNSNVGNRAISFFSTGRNYEIGGQKVVGVFLSQLGNPNIRWETTTEWNAGLDLGFFRNRIQFTIEYFNRIISDLLNTQSLMSYYEVPTIMSNVGKTRSQGLELTLNTRNIETSNFGWSTTFTFTSYRDRWLERDQQWKPSAYSVYDSPIRYLSGYLSDGLIQAGEEIPWMKNAIPGQVKLKDIDGYIYNEDGTFQTDEHGIPLHSGKPDGKLDDMDKVIYGTTDPSATIGINNAFRYKSFDLSFYFYGQFGMLNNGSYRDVWLYGDGTTVKNINRGYNMPVSIQDTWTHDNPDATRPGYFYNDNGYGVGDYFLKNLWFIRLQNLSLGYTFNSPIKGLSSLRLSADANNLLMFSPYDGLDLETDNSVWAYPNVRTFTFGIEMTF